MASQPAISQSDRARAGLVAIGVKDMIVLLGGHDGARPARTAELFEPDRDDIADRGTWHCLPPFLAQRAYFSANAIGNLIYAIGGSAHGKTLNTMEAFDMDQGKWSVWFNLPPMQTKRTLHGSIAWGGKIYVCGGFDGMRDLKSVECYNPATNSWQWKDNMSSGRSYVTLVLIGNLIYAIGGQDRNVTGAKALTGCRAKKTVETYDLYCEVWEEATPLLTGRIGAAAAVLLGDDGKQYIWVCGGSDGSEVLSSVEYFDIKAGVWHEAPPMSCRRLGHAAAVANNRLYAIGGFDGDVPLNTFECFDPAVGAWGPPLKMGVETELLMRMPSLLPPS